jgi:hypothetical protein
LASARENLDEKRRVKVLTRLAPHLTAFPPPDLALLWLETQNAASLLYFLARRTWKDLLTDLRALVPVIAALGGAKAVAETFHAIQAAAAGDDRTRIGRINGLKGLVIRTIQQIRVLPPRHGGWVGGSGGDLPHHPGRGAVVAGDWNRWGR